MYEYTYRSTFGLCNMDEGERKRRLAIGIAGVSMAAALWLQLIFSSAPPYYQAIVFIPGWIGFLGIWQSGLSYCSDHELYHKGLSRRHFYSAIAAALFTTGLFSIGLFISPIPSTVMKEAYMRLQEGILIRRRH